MEISLNRDFKNIFYSYGKNGFNYGKTDLRINLLGNPCNSMTKDDIKDLIESFIEAFNKVWNTFGENEIQVTPEMPKVEELLFDCFVRLHDLILFEFELEKLRDYQWITYSIGDLLILSVKDTDNKRILNFDIGMLYSILEFLDAVVNQSVSGTYASVFIVPNYVEKQFNVLLDNYRETKSFILGRGIDIVKDNKTIRELNELISNAMCVINRIKEKYLSDDMSEDVRTFYKEIPGYLKSY